jgi:hypothetical protein
MPTQREGGAENMDARFDSESVAQVAQHECAWQFCKSRKVGACEE